MTGTFSHIYISLSIILCSSLCMSTPFSIVCKIYGQIPTKFCSSHTLSSWSNHLSSNTLWSCVDGIKEWQTSFECILWWCLDRVSWVERGWCGRYSESWCLLCWWLSGSYAKSGPKTYGTWWGELGIRSSRWSWWSKIPAFSALVKSSWDIVSSLSYLFLVLHYVVTLRHRLLPIWCQIREVGV